MRSWTTRTLGSRVLISLGNVFILVFFMCVLLWLGGLVSCPRCYTKCQGIYSFGIVSLQFDALNTKPVGFEYGLHIVFCFLNARSILESNIAFLYLHMFWATVLEALQVSRLQVCAGLQATELCWYYWLQDQLMWLCEDRVLNNVRGCRNAVHELWQYRDTTPKQYTRN